jgi:hypothetical protein
MDVGWDAATIIGDCYGLVGVDGHDNAVAMTRQRFVDRVVHHLENHVVKARSVIGVTDVHARSFSNCVKTL